MTRRHATEDDLLMDLIKTNRRTDGETMSKKQYEKHGEYNPWQAVNKFGSWYDAKTSAGIYKKSPDRTRVSDEELLKDVKKVSDSLDREIKAEDYLEHGEYGLSTLYNRFGSFKTVRGKAYNI